MRDDPNGQNYIEIPLESRFIAARLECPDDNKQVSTKFNGWPQFVVTLTQLT